MCVFQSQSQRENHVDTLMAVCVRKALAGIIGSLQKIKFGCFLSGLLLRRQQKVVEQLPKVIHQIIFFLRSVFNLGLQSY